MKCSFIYAQRLTNTIQDAYSKHSYNFNIPAKGFVNHGYVLNIFGIRSTTGKVGTYDDLIGIARKCDIPPHVATIDTPEHSRAYNFATKICVDIFRATTDPGLYYMLRPMNPKGTFILAEGYHKAMFTKGLHQGKYSALVQNAPVRGFRDNNKDYKHDFVNPCIESNAGINLHHGGSKFSELIGMNSAGCQVINTKDSFEAFMWIIDNAWSKSTRPFDYTLFNDTQV